MLVNLSLISKDVAADEELPLDLVRKVSRFMFKDVRDTMSKGDFESIYLQYLGTFDVHPYRAKLFKERMSL